MASGENNKESKISNNPRHVHRSNQLKQLRESAGLTQEVLAGLIGTSRKRLNQIENCHEVVMRKLEADLVESWYDVCARTATESQKRTFKDAVLTWFTSRF